MPDPTVAETPDLGRSDRKVAVIFSIGAAVLLAVALVMAVTSVGGGYGEACGSVLAPASRAGLACERAVDDRRATVWMLGAVGFLVAGIAGWLWWMLSKKPTP
jgi:hypothetical protein